MPDAGYPAGLSGMFCRILPDIRLFIAGYPDIRPDNPALPDIRPNPNQNTTIPTCYIFITGSGGDSEVQRTMLELLNQLDGFEATKNIKVDRYINTDR